MTLFTIGYEGYKLPEFIDQLLRNGITLLADVRLSPISRKSGFSKSALARELGNVGIKYIHMKDFGTPKVLRNKLSETGDRVAFRAEYRELISSKTESLRTLNDFIQKEQVALMCFEKNPGHCHRSVLAWMVKEVDGNSLEIQQL